jgi:hypothetical protein
MVNEGAADVAVEELPDLVSGEPSGAACRASRMRSAMESPTQLPKREAAE